MTTLNEARLHIQNRFLVEWGANSDIEFTNEELTPPASGPWVRLVVRNTKAQQETLGPKGRRKYTRDGRIFIQIFTDANSGTSQSDLLAEQAKDIFQGEEFNNIYVNNCSIREVGTDGKWYQVLVECNFFYDETK